MVWATRTELFLRDRFRQAEHLLADFTTGEHQHHQDLAPVSADQFQVFENGAFRMWGGDQRGSLGLVSQDRSCQAHPAIDVGAGLVELVDDGALGGGGQLGIAHQLADEIAIAFFGGHAPGGSMRLAQIAQLRSAPELIADGGRAEIEFIVLDQGVRTDWLGGLDIVTDDQCEDEVAVFRLVRSYLSGNF